MKFFQRCLVLLATCGCLTGQLGCRTDTPADKTNSATLALGEDGAWHVHPGENIQVAIDRAGEDPTHKIVKVHAGTYFPAQPGQAMIWFNKRHDGVQLQAVGQVTLTAANEDVAIATSRSFPAIVNHVVYFGDGISPQTSIDGFTITGAKSFSTKKRVDLIEPNLTPELQPGLFFFSDGGGIKIFGNSSPVLRNLDIVDNETLVCGGGVSVEHRGTGADPVAIENCRFLRNRCPATGSAIDLLEGSTAIVKNCLFVGNIGNYGMDNVARKYRLTYNYKHGCGAITVFPKSTITLVDCTLTENWSGADDQGSNSQYTNCLFWKNDKSDGSRPGKPFELDVNLSAKVSRCVIHGEIDDLQKVVDRKANKFIDVDPDFDEAWVPQDPTYAGIGYRPTNRTPNTTTTPTRDAD